MSEFDLRVVLRDPKTGRVVKHQPYRRRVVKGVTTYERPVGSGNLWYENGDSAGRWVVEEGKPGRQDETVKHVQWTPPPTEDQIVQNKLATQERAILELERKLALAEAKTEVKAEEAKQLEEKYEVANLKAKKEKVSGTK